MTTTKMDDKRHHHLRRCNPQHTNRSSAFVVSRSKTPNCSKVNQSTQHSNRWDRNSAAGRLETSRSDGWYATEPGLKFCPVTRPDPKQLVSNSAIPTKSLTNACDSTPEKTTIYSRQMNKSTGRNDSQDDRPPTPILGRIHKLTLWLRSLTSWL